MIQHGHNLLLNLEVPESRALNLIEIGTTRGHGNSSLTLARYCKTKGINFISVDIDNKLIDKTRRKIKKLNEKFQAIVSKGEIFLKNYKGKIFALYLDAFDCDHKKHNPHRLKFYKKYLNQELTNENCHRMHLECVKNAINNVIKGGYICIDDVFNNKDWEGKGKTAIPYLLNNGFSILKYSEEHRAVLLIKD